MVRRTLLPALAAVALCAATAGAQSTRHTTRSTSSARGTTRSATRASTREASAAAWTPVYTDESVSVALDRAGTHRRSDGTYDAHLKWTYSKDKAIGRNKSYRTLVERRYLDCTSLASKPVSGDTYDAANSAVSHYTTSARDLTYVDWATRPAGTSGAKAYAGVCAALRGR
jgi:hypothetical protein